MDEIVERRRVVIEYDLQIRGDRGSQDNNPAPAKQVSPAELARLVKRELLLDAKRNGGSTGLT